MKIFVFLIIILLSVFCFQKYKTNGEKSFGKKSINAIEKQEIERNKNIPELKKVEIFPNSFEKILERQIIDVENLEEQKPNLLNIIPCTNTDTSEEQSLLLRKINSINSAEEIKEDNINELNTDIVKNNSTRVLLAQDNTISLLEQDKNKNIIKNLNEEDLMNNNSRTMDHLNESNFSIDAAFSDKKETIKNTANQSSDTIRGHYSSKGSSNETQLDILKKLTHEKHNPSIIVHSSYKANSPKNNILE